MSDRYRVAGEEVPEAEPEVFDLNPFQWTLGVW